MADAALENVTHCLALAEAQNDELKTFITLTPEQARTDAAAADVAATEGRWLGLLHGMPMAIKDNIDTAGIRTTSGAGFWAERVPNGMGTAEEKKKQGKKKRGHQVDEAAARRRQSFLE